MATAMSPAGAVLWSKNTTYFASTMAAVTADGHVLLISEDKGAFLNKVEPATGNIVGWSAHEEVHDGAPIKLEDTNVQAAAITVDASGMAWIPSGHGVTMVTNEGNVTSCGIDAMNSIGSVSLPADGVLLQLNIHGMLLAMA
jgi:hypothetical protein